MLGVFVQLEGHRYGTGYVVQENGCWEWAGSTRSGYGRMRHNGRPQQAHRVYYKLLKGPIPGGLQIDHLCRNPLCVNPDHMEPVTHRTNSLRGVGAPAANAKKTHCPRGHSYAGENVYFPPSGGRQCRRCRLMHIKRWYESLSFEQRRERNRHYRRREPRVVA